MGFIQRYDVGVKKIDAAQPQYDVKILQTSLTGIYVTEDRTPDVYEWWVILWVYFTLKELKPTAGLSCQGCGCFGSFGQGFKRTELFVF